MTPLTNRSLLRALPLPFLFLGGALHAQLTVDNSQDPITLVNDILVGQGVAVSNVTFNGVPLATTNDQIGSFNGVASNIGLAGGITICTGKVIQLPGPNFLTGSTVSPASPNETPDPDLMVFSGGSQHCVAALEFDFIPTGDSISFRFVFGSEEYPEYVCTNFNDAFGFFLSGPGISGPFSHQAINLARVPGTGIPVAINTVNPGVPGSNGGNASTCAASDPNWQANSIFYVDNPEPDPFFNPTTTVELDGFTVPLTAHATVQCGQIYHIKMVIANGTDGTLDSAVFIEGGSFSSASSLVATATTPQGDGTLTEGCGNAVVTLTRSGTHGDAVVTLASAGNGITPGDVTPIIPGTVTIPNGSTSVSFPVGAVRDDTAEGAEGLTIAAAWASSCGTVLYDTLTITLLDYTPIAIDAHDMYLHCDQDSVLLEAHAAGGLG
ncbi:MAG: choice-of-anchor L domain-containing protein, partial [Bacteroidetes bacterium]|nr:choice-of-anchor L domain-containing protein [Bacteroidota bacterium]